MNNIGIFIHIGNILLWDEICSHINKIKDNKIFLFVNFCKDLISQIDIKDYKKIIKKEFPNSIFFENKNKGCDIGPFFLFLDYLRNNKIKMDWLIKIHTKSNKKWRTNLLKNLFPDNFNEMIKKLDDNEIPVHGAYPYPYDYFNIKYDLENIKLLNLNVSKDWTTYTNNYPETLNINVIEKRYHAQNANKNYKFTPDIDLELYNFLFGDQKEDHNIVEGKYKWNLINKIIGKDIKLYYFPGTFLLLKHEILENIFKDTDYKKIYNSLENQKLDDNIYQSNTHSWERILPISFQLYKKYM
ncbi:MAG: hypothetical protein ISQ85_06875 [Planktomarina sp.]|nr:hypothetical protein [Planktomarina sp.]